MAIEPELDILEAKGLVRLAVWQPEVEYLFRHWLVQDAAYGSLLKQERRELHRRVGEALEAMYPERRGELAGVLAMHFEQAGDTEKALEHLILAGRHALARNAIREAYSAFDRAASLLPPAGAAESDPLRRQRVEIQTGRAQASWSFRPTDEIIADLDAIVSDAERLGDPDLIAPIHVALVMMRLSRGERPTSPLVKRSLDRIAEIGEAANDPSLRALPLALVGTNQAFIGPVRDGVRALEEAIPHLESRFDPIGAAFARGALAIGYASLGEFEKAKAAARNATALAANGDVIAQLDAQIAEAWIRSAGGELDEALPIARMCVERGEETGATACVLVSAWILGDVYERQGKLNEAMAAFERAMDLAQVIARAVWRPTLQAWLGSTAAGLGRATGGNLEEALELARSIGNRVGEAGVLGKRAEATVRLGHPDQALADFEASAAILESEGLRPGLARVLHGWGVALRAAGRTAEGDEKLQRALALFDELGIRTDADAVRAALSGSSLPG